MLDRNRRLAIVTLAALATNLPVAADNSHSDPPSSHVFVGASGKDNNGCGTAKDPCRNLQAAVARVTPGGEITFVDAGPFPGTTIDKAVTLTASAGIGTIGLAFPGLYVGAAATDVVTLRGLVLKGVTNTIVGVQIGTGRALIVEDCALEGMGTAIGATGGQTILRNTTIRTSTTGVDARTNSPSTYTYVTVDGCAFESNNGAIYAADNASIAVMRSTFTDNDGGLVTIPAAGRSASATADHCLFSNNRNGLFANSSGGYAILRLSNSTVTGNVTGVQVNDATLYSLGNNTIYGNMIDGDWLLTPLAPR